jgi:hypothetical protein
MRYISKKKSANLTVKTIINNLKKLSLKSRPKLLFIAPYNHHTVHLEPVIEKINKANSYDITLIGPFTTRDGISIYSSMDELNFYDTFEMVISTDFGFIPWWLNAKKVFFGHGIGPKLNYQANASLKSFDYSFCPCKPIYESQKDSGVLTFKVGLPLLDDKVNKNDVLKTNNNIRRVVYAPSWCNNTDVLSEMNKILDKLEKLSEQYSVIISPHPNLLDPNLCKGKHFFDNTTLNINYPACGRTTIDLCADADIVISDISSVMFESLAIGKSVYFDGNYKIYDYCGATEVYKEMIENIPTILWDQDLERQLSVKYPNNKDYIEDYGFNIGNAVDVFIATVHELLKNKR